MQKLVDIIKGKRSKELSLTNLTLTPFLNDEAWQRVLDGRKKRKEYEKKYGDKWLEQYHKDMGYEVDYDLDMKMVNTAIMNRHPMMINGYSEHVIELKEKWEERLKELFGPDCDYMRFFSDESINPEKALIEDALRTEKWKELPDKLQEEYHKQKDTKK